MERVLYISYDGMTDPLGQSQVIPYLAGLSHKGFDISLLSAEKNNNFLLHKDKIKTLLSQYNIKWIPISYTKNPPILSTWFDIVKLNKTASRLHINEPFDIIHCRSYISAFIGLKMKKKFNTRFVFDMRGFWADERVDGKIWNLKNPVFKGVYNFFKYKEKQFLTNADKIVSLTYSAKKEMLSWNQLNILEKNITVIPCCADLELFSYEAMKSQTGKEWRKKLNISDNTYVISYLGSVGTWYMIDEMMAFFKVLQKKIPDSVFLFISKDNKNSIIQHALKIQIDKSKIVVQPAEMAEVPQLISATNASVFFIKPVWSKKASSPTKMAELMGMGIPIVANAGVGDVDMIIEKSPTGILIENFSDTDYEKAVDTLINIVDFEKPAVRQLACENFSLENGITNFEDIYRTDI